MNVDVALIMPWVLRAVWVYLALEWLCLLRQLLSLKSDVVPAELNLGERDAVKAHLENLRGGSLLFCRARGLLEAWTQGWSPHDVASLAGSQAARTRHRLRGSALFALLLTSACIAQGSDPKLAWLTLAALGVTLLAASLIYTRIDQKIESELLTELPANLPGTAMTAPELATALGASIDAAFKHHVPQPDKVAAAIGTSVEAARKASTEGIEAVFKKLVDGQTAMLDRWTDHEKAIVASLDASRKTLETASSNIASSLSGGAEKIQSALSHHAQQLDKATSDLGTRVKGGLEPGVTGLQTTMALHAQQLEKTTNTWNEQIRQSLTSHADQMNKASQAIAGQLDKIMALEKEIQQILHIQQTVEGTLKTVTTTDEFKQTMVTLKNHLQESDKLIREVTKPRTIRLVETEGESASE